MKTSYFQDRKCYSITVSEDGYGDSDREAARRFRSETGWKLSVNGRTETDCELHEEGEQETGYTLHSAFIPADSTAGAAEQNQAFQQIDDAFTCLDHRPDKKSLKQDSKGKYLEVSFISPMIGSRYGAVLQELANQTGWRIKIGDKVNQNALFNLIQLLCMKHSMTPVKNPSYLPERKKVQIKVCGQLEEGTLHLVMEEFRKQTGCECEVIKVP